MGEEHSVALALADNLPFGGGALVHVLVAAKKAYLDVGEMDKMAGRMAKELEKTLLEVGQTNDIFMREDVSPPSATASYEKACREATEAAKKWERKNTEPGIRRRIKRGVKAVTQGNVFKKHFDEIEKCHKRYMEEVLLRKHELDAIRNKSTQSKLDKLLQLMTLAVGQDEQANKMVEDFKREERLAIFYRNELKNKIFLGNMGHATVYKCKICARAPPSPPPPPGEVAIRILEASKDDTPAVLTALAIREAFLMSQIHHPHVVRQYGIWIYPSQIKFEIGVVTEHVEGYDTMLNSLEKAAANYTQLLEWLRQLASALDHLASKGIRHCDVQSQNVLVDPHGNLLLANFGRSKDDDRHNTSYTSFKAGKKRDCAYASPELLEWETTNPNAAPSGPKGPLRQVKVAPAIPHGASSTVPLLANECPKPYSEKSDVYSFGMTMWEMKRGHRPWEGVAEETLIEEVRKGGRPEIPGNWPENYCKLMERCWAQIPGERPTFRDVTFEIDDIVDDEFQESNRKHEAAVKVQVQVRRRQVQPIQELKRKHEAALKLQCEMRRRRSSWLFQQALEATVKMQSQVRRRQAQQLLQEIKRKYDEEWFVPLLSSQPREQKRIESHQKREKILGRDHGPEQPQFGTPPRELIQIDAAPLDSRFHIKVPKVLEMLRGQLLFHNGAQQERIFHETGTNGAKNVDIPSCEKIKACLDDGTFMKTSCSDAHMCAYLIKIWFREMPGGLLRVFTPLEMNDIPKKQQSKAIAAMLDVEEPHRSLLVWIFEVMAYIVANEKTNLMTAELMAKAMAPNLLYVSSKHQASTPEGPLELAHPKIYWEEKEKFKRVSTFLKLMLEHWLRERRLKQGFHFLIL